MILTQAESIQILRKRTGLNQGVFGSKAFNTSFEAGRTKMKNIELGRQIPTRDDLEKMARIMGLPVSELSPDKNRDNKDKHDSKQGVILAREVLDLYPGLDDYVDMLNKAAKLNDSELITYIATKIAQMISLNPVEEATAG